MYKIWCLNYLTLESSSIVRITISKGIHLTTNRYPTICWNFEQRSVKFLLLFFVTGSWLLFSFSPLLRRKVWVLSIRPEAITQAHIHTTAGFLPPLQWAAGTGTARVAMGLWVQEKSKRRSSQSTVGTIWNFNER